MSARTAIFDLDGTLLDTLEDLYLSVNHALRWAGLPERTMDEVRLFVGNGIRLLVQRSIGVGREGGVEAVDPEQLEAVLAEFSQDYAEHCTDHTAPYPGVPEMLARVRAGGVAIGVVSNKADFAVQELVAQQFPDTFDCVMGENEAAGIRKKPAPDMITAALNQIGHGREGLIYVGDSEVDLETAANVDCPCVICTWGFRDRNFLIERGATILVDTPDELGDLLLTWSS